MYYTIYKTKQKISKAMKGKHTGIKNSQYGTCWITKNSTNKKIKKETLNEWLTDGWKRGRVL